MADFALSQIREGAQGPDLEGLRGAHGQLGPKGQAICCQGELPVDGSQFPAGASLLVWIILPPLKVAAQQLEFDLDDCRPGNREAHPHV